MPGAEPNYRPGTVADAEAVARLVIDGFEEYRSFAPEGWSPPSLAGEVERLGELLPDPDVWCLLAESGGELAGQVTFMPAARHWSAVDDPSLAHLRTLFVRRDFWGTGVATALHAAAVEEARERAYAHMRLFTPAQQRRARRFYEREGWAVAGDEYHDPGPDLVIVEYRRALGGA
jgi:GNAT superfamily N-acetyltransferase